MTEQRTQIPDELAGQRLDQALAQMFPEYSRSRLKAWLLGGSVLIDGEMWRPRDRVSGGETVVVQPVAEVAVHAGPEAIPLDVVFEDDSLLVVNKPAGLVVHPGAGNVTGTLMNGLLHHEPALEQLPRAGIIHRIDKDTSGLLLVAKSLPAHTALVRNLADRDIARQYLAICNGVLTGGGTIDAAIARHPVDRTRMAVTPGGRPALTHYTVAERFRGHALLAVRLETGRTHQIRVHLAHVRHPLVGDPVYGGRARLPPDASPELIAVLRGFRRQALHAARLALVHPRSGASLAWEAPLPDNLTALLAALRTDALRE